MADGTRNIDGSMEGASSFDLNDAVRCWRQEAAQHPGLLADNIEELEAHLRDSISKLQNQGLSNEESFWIASRRLGSPSAIAEEFSRVNRKAIWMDRLLWMILGYVFFQTIFSLQNLAALGATIARKNLSPFIIVAAWGIPLLAAVWLVRRVVRNDRPPTVIRKLLRHPVLLAFTAFGCMVLPALIRGLSIAYAGTQISTSDWMVNGIISLAYPLPVVAAIFFFGRFRMRSMNR